MAKRNGTARGIYERAKGSGVWWIRYVDQDGKLHREKAWTKALAIDLYRQRKTQIREGKFFPDKIGRQKVVLFDELAKDFLDYSQAQKRSHKQDASRIKRLMKTFGGKPAQKVSLEDVERFRIALMTQTRKLALGTIQQYTDLLHAMYNRAIRFNKIQNHHNPVVGLTPLKIDNARVRYLSDAEEMRLFSELPKYLHPIVELALLTGLRRSNLLSVEWKNIDLTARVYTIPMSKSGKALRLPLHPRAHEILVSLPKNGPYVFGRNGKPRKSVAPSFGNAVRRAEILDFRFHDLRHTWASRLAMAGVDVLTIQKLGGWNNLKMVMRYTHLSPGHMREELGKLPSPRTGTPTDTAENEPNVEKREKTDNDVETKESTAVGDPI